MSKRSEAKRKNCAKCNKSLKRSQWYYRNGNYFCNSGCFKSYSQKEETA